MVTISDVDALVLGEIARDAILERSPNGVIDVHSIGFMTRWGTALAAEIGFSPTRSARGGVVGAQRGWRHSPLPPSAEHPVELLAGCPFLRGKRVGSLRAAAGIEDIRLPLDKRPKHRQCLIAPIRLDFCQSIALACPRVIGDGN
ncbi:MAG: hypothetical protein KGK10_06775 [Rhodospirillales bacterium]|nr:hypothetical protein [Rhodospirillales bacterium]